MNAVLIYLCLVFFDTGSRSFAENVAILFKYYGKIRVQSKYYAIRICCTLVVVLLFLTLFGIFKIQFQIMIFRFELCNLRTVFSCNMLKTIFIHNNFPSKGRHKCDITDHRNEIIMISFLFVNVQTPATIAMNSFAKVDGTCTATPVTRHLATQLRHLLVRWTRVEVGARTLISWPSWMKARTLLCWLW